MPALSPRPLSAEVPLAAAAISGAGVSPLGVWLPSRHPLTIAVVRGRQRLTLLIDGDLVSLLRRCAAVVVRLGPAIAVVPTDELLRARARCAGARVSVLSSRVVYRMPAADVERSPTPPVGR